MGEHQEPMTTDQLARALLGFEPGTPVEVLYDCGCASTPVLNVRVRCGTVVLEGD